MISWAGWTIASFFVLWFEPKATFDIQLHDTYIIFWKYEMVLEVGNLFGLLGLMYYYFPRLFKRPLRRGLGMAHFGGCVLLSVMWFWPNLSALPLGYLNYERWRLYNAILEVLILVGLVGQLAFLVNVVYSMVGGRKSVD